MAVMAVMAAMVMMMMIQCRVTAAKLDNGFVQQRRGNVVECSALAAGDTATCCLQQKAVQCSGVALLVCVCAVGYRLAL